MSYLPSRARSKHLSLVEQQIAEKDAQIATLTSLLQEAHALIARQQHIEERYLALHAGAPHTETAQQPDDRPRISTPEPVTAPERSESSTEAPGSPGDERPVNAAPPDNTESIRPPVAALSPILAPADKVTRDRERSWTDDSQQDHPPIPISYFGPPLSGVEDSLRSAAATSNVISEEGRSIPLEPRGSRPTPAASFDRPAGGTGTLLVPAVVGVVVVILVISILAAMNHSSAGMSEMSGESLLAAKKRIASGPTGDNSRQPVLRQGTTTQTLPPIASRSAASDDLASTGAHPAATVGLPAAPVTGPGSTLTQSSAAEPPGVLSSSLLEAVTKNDLPRVRTLLDQGADVNAHNAHGASALSIAARYGFQGIVELLLARGAYVNSTNDRYWTPLMLAVNYNHAAVVRTLLKHRVRPDDSNAQGSTALMLAAQLGNQELVGELLAAGATPGMKNTAGRSARDLAAQHRYSAIAGILEQAADKKP